MELRDRKASLEDRLRQLGSVVVAYSGGIDSAYLAYTAHAVLGERMIAVLADSASLARSQFQDAILFAEENRIPFRSVETQELQREAYAANGPDRCFHCKDELFTVLEAERIRLGFASLAYGLNVDDKQDFRPGHRAAAKHSVTAPLAEAGLSKADVRELAQAAGLRIWDKPASACLSSRVEYGRRVTPEALLMIEKAEDALRLLGLRRFRVRYHGTVARVEIAEEEMPEALNVAVFKKISVAVREAGFQYVAVDCEGYRSGSMNEILPIEVLTRSTGQSRVDGAKLEKVRG
jgi:pyridinium-3,5-biscarboxylic acid mononucleotide sulfurtransferase